MDRLISAQFWRVAFFRVAEDEINYRRFFNINDLAGLRMELAPVFAHAHARVLRMLEAGEIDGLRIDHVDGLFDPKSYLTALRERGRAAFLSRGREDPRAARAPARRLAGRGHDRLRLSQSFAGPARRSVRRRRVLRDLPRLRRRGRTFRRDRHRVQAQDHGQRDGERTRRARPRRGAARPPEPDDGGSHPRDPDARDQGDRRLLSGLPHLCRSLRRARRGRPARHRLGDRARAPARSGRPCLGVRLPRERADRREPRIRRRARSAEPRRCASR